MEDLFSFLVRHKQEILDLRSKKERINKILNLCTNFTNNVLQLPQDKNQLKIWCQQHDKETLQSFESLRLRLKLSNYLLDGSINGEDNLSSFLREVLNGIER